MSGNTFINKLDEICKEARRKRQLVSSSNVYSLWAQYSSDEMVLFNGKGDHFLSYGDVIPASAITFVWRYAKQMLGNESDFTCSIDASDYSPFHYAAIYSLDDIFKTITHVDNRLIKNMCRHINIESRHSVASLLVERDRSDILELLVNLLNLSPFTSDFQDIYVSWLHDAIFYNAKSVALYLFRNHHRSLQLSLLRRTRNQYEYVTPMDAVLLSEHIKDRHFYVDVILWNLKQGLKLNSIPFSHVMMDDSLSGTSAVHCIKSRCISDTLLNRMGIQ
jgi:hypothetical protein